MRFIWPHSVQGVHPWLAGSVVSGSVERQGITLTLWQLVNWGGVVSTRQGESAAFKGMLIFQPLPTILYSLKLLPPSAIITKKNQAFSM